ncbi:hypothetical protein EC968_001460 [Mortierella alpina]|nr:hypothetical protein EC968_001460 [Mortierella alpina]
MRLSDMLDNSRSSSSLFSLPSIPYFFTITPYPLRAALALPSCQSTQRCVSMKRRLHAETSQKDDAALSDLSLPADFDEQTAEGYEEATTAIWPNGVSAQESYEGGIEGRVLRKMKRIKLDSESPPAEPFDNLIISPSQLDATRGAIYETPRHVHEGSIHEQHLLAARADQLRMLGPIRISTKSCNSKEAAPSSTSTDIPTAIYNVHPQDSDAAVYYGMNNLLHQMHATRYGIPAETLSETMLSPDRSQEVQAWQQQQQEEQQQKQDQHGFQHMPYTASTAWHQAQRSLASDSQVVADDEDNDMEGVDEGNDGRTLFSASQNQQFMNSRPKQYLRGEYTSPTRQQVYGDVVNGGLAPNAYEDINAQLRAAFLARAELERGH